MKKTNGIRWVKKNIVIGMLLIGMISGCGSGSSFTKEQAMVKYGYDDLKGGLLDPESLIIYDCYGWTSQSEEQMNAASKAKVKDEDEEFPDDIYAVYYHIGARNQMGGISEEEYLYVYDLETGKYKASDTKKENKNAVDAYLAGDSSAVFDRDIQGEFLNVEFWNMMGWPDRAASYKEFIESEEFEKIDPEKILN